MSDPLPIVPFTRPARGTVALPGSKSITNRALILAALADRSVALRGALFSRDTRVMTAALRQLGFSVAENEGDRTIVVEGRGGEIPAGQASLFVGNAGTAARFLPALVSLRPDGIYEFDGDPAMRARPISGLLDALVAQGAETSSRGFPFTLRTHGLAGGTVTVDASASSQLLSALLLVAPSARRPLDVELAGSTVSRPFVTMTEKMVREFAARPSEYLIEGDATAASYFAALTFVTGGNLRVDGLRLGSEALQGDAAFCTLLAERGLLRIDGTTLAAGPERHGFSADFNAYSDTFLSLAAIAPLLEGPTRISGIAHTRRQETDRVAGMARELTRLGQQVVETEDALEIHPRPLKTDVTIETYDDHRFAMSFGVLGCHDLNANGRPWLSIAHPECCGKTFPEYFDVLDGIRTGAAAS